MCADKRLLRLPCAIPADNREVCKIVREPKPTHVSAGRGERYDNILRDRMQQVCRSGLNIPISFHRRQNMCCPAKLLARSSPVESRNGFFSLVTHGYKLLGVVLWLMTEPKLLDV